MNRGRIRGLGLERVALVGIAVALALAPLTVRGQEVVSVRDGHRPRHACLVIAHVESGRGLLDRSRSRRERARSPARRGERRDRSRSHASLSCSIDRSRSIERLPAPSARWREDETGRLARRGTQEGVEAVASQPPVAPGGSVDVTPVAEGHP